MAKILCRTKANTDPKGKPRVYFTCHPGDFERHFDAICQDIFKTHDCAIFYTEDMTAAISGTDRSTDLESNNLFVVPVTFRLLTQPNRAMDEDIPYAMAKKIPILPIMMEPEIRDLYAKRFGRRQSLNRNTGDATEISYEEKLKKFLESVLISNDQAERIRREFMGYIFLSYRKMDRGYARELMKQIHSDPKFRDIAIWYDEFLTPGENFMDNIQKAIRKSRLFALLVTPNVLKKRNGKPNFVVGKEYPAACKEKKTVLPVEMEPTDRDALEKNFENIPPCVQLHSDAFRQSLMATMTETEQCRADSPAHKFLIGLAYFEGVDMETDRDLGEELITAAAREGHFPAMEKLYHILDSRGDYGEAGIWAEKLEEHYRQTTGDDSLETLNWTENRANVLYMLGQYSQARDMLEKCYAKRCALQSPEHPAAVIVLSNLAMVYADLGDDARGLEIANKVYSLRCKQLGKEHPDTLTALSHLIKIYCNFGLVELAMAFCLQVYDTRCCHLGKEHWDTLVSGNDMAVLYSRQHKPMLAVELMEEIYPLRCALSGEDHPESLTCLENLGVFQGEYGMTREGLANCQKAYDGRRRVLGAEHPKTIEALNNLGLAYFDAGEEQTALDLCDKAYLLMREHLGEEHPLAMSILSNLAGISYRMGNRELSQSMDDMADEIYARKKDAEQPLLEKLWTLLQSVEPGEDMVQRLWAAWGEPWEEHHPSTLFYLLKMADLCQTNGPTMGFSLVRYDAKEAYLLEKAYAVACNFFGPDGEFAMDLLSRLASVCDNCNLHEKHVQIRQQILALRQKEYGKESPQLYWELRELGSAYRKWGKYAQALECYDDAYTRFRKQDFLGEDILLLSYFPETYEALGEYEKALAWHRKRFDYFRGIMGDDAAAPINALIDMIRMNEKLGNYEEMVCLAEQIRDIQGTSPKMWHIPEENLSAYLKTAWEKLGLCRRCGGSFRQDGFCEKCGAKKDY